MTTATDTLGVNLLRQWQRRAREYRLPKVPMVIMGVMLICAVFAPLLSPHDPTEVSLLDSRIAPGEDWNFPLATDTMGAGHAEPSHLRRADRRQNQPASSDCGNGGGYRSGLGFRLQRGHNGCGAHARRRRCPGLSHHPGCPDSRGDLWARE